jgi:3-methyladenine DNA glycosylase AlkD
MNRQTDWDSTKQIAEAIDADMRALSIQNAKNSRSVRRKYTKLLRHVDGSFMMDICKDLKASFGYWWLTYELLHYHTAAFRSMGEKELEEFGHGINSWGTVDSFGRLLAGPAWLKGQISDAVIHRWARSDDLWWRRAALVSTVALNVRSHGGYGDTARTLEVCRLLVADHEDMVVKAMSWALRALVVHDPDGVSAFLEEHNDVLAARVKREVKNKLTTGLKNPRSK